MYSTRKRGEIGVVVVGVACSKGPLVTEVEAGKITVFLKKLVIFNPYLRAAGE